MKVPCTDIDLERRFVATKLAFANQIETPDLLPMHLTAPRLQEIYRAALYLDANEDGWNIDSIINHLECSGKLSEVGRDYLLDVYDSKRDVEFNIKPMVKQLRRYADARTKRDALVAAIRHIENAEYEKADETIFKLSDSVLLKSEARIYSANDLALETRKAVESLKGGKKLVIPTGIGHLDQYIGGLIPGGMFTIAGYSSTGKSQLTLLISKNIAEKGYPVGIISVEDPPLITGSRLVSQVTKQISSKNIFIGETTPERIDQILGIIDEHRETFERLPLHVAVSHTATASDVVDVALKLIKENMCRVIALDYIQRVRVDYKARRYDKAMSDIAKQLKGVCSRHDVALLLASQLARPKESTIYRKPHPNQLKESGDLENESEVILMLWDESADANARTMWWIAKGKIGNKGAEGVLVLNTKTGMIESMEEKDDGNNRKTEKRNGRSERSYHETKNDYD
jgi:replicative DNA helicase